MGQLLIEHPILLLFVVASLGYLLGTVKINGSSLGVAAVLFVGLALGASNPEFKIPDIVFTLGLVLFVYSIGISSGAAFFESYKRNGLRDFLFITSMLILTGFIAVAIFYLFGFSSETITGIYAGSTTNTPALAGVIDYINSFNPGGDNSKEMVIAYSFTYPMGVLGGIIGVLLMEKLLKIDFKKEKEDLKFDYPVANNLSSRTLKITNPDIFGMELRDIVRDNKLNISFGRMSGKDMQLSLSSYGDSFQDGDLLVVVGSKKELDRAEKIFGERSEKKLSYYREKYDSRRIFMSNPRLAGRTISSLNLSEKFGAIITRIRRGDVDMLAKGNTVLELGDRIRFVARRKDLNSLSDYFGDSYSQVSQVNLFSFGLGIGIGLLIGCIEVHLAGLNFKLGYAGGLLLVGLILGALRRTGPIVWTMPYSANITLQQIGLILLLAAIGVSSGHSLVESISGDGLIIFTAGAIISLLTAILTLWIGYKFVKIPFTLLMGMVANQPAILDFAKTKAKSDIPVFGYTMMFPIALIGKIVIAQILFILLS